MIKRILLICLYFGCIYAPLSWAQNVDPSIDVSEIDRVQLERDQIFSALIDDPTNMDNLFQYANLSILLGDLEAAVGVFEQMLIYDDELPRIRLELGVLYYRLGAYTTAKVYLDSVKRYNPPPEVLENVDDFLGAITESEKPLKFSHVIGTSIMRSSNGNSGLSADIINIAGYPFLVSPDTKQQPDMSRSLSYTMSVNHDLNHPRGDTARYIVSLSDTKQDEFNRFDLQTMVFSASRQYNLEPDENSRSLMSYFTSPTFVPAFNAFKVYLDGEGLLTSRKLSTTFSGILDGTSSAGFEVFVDYRKFLSNPAKSGRIKGFVISNNRFIDKYGMTAQVKYGYDHHNANIDSENYDQHILELSANKMIENDWMVSSNLGFRRKKHDSGTEIFPMRRDKVLTFQISASKPISECWISNFSYRYSKSKSTVDLFNIKNNQISMDYNHVCLGR